MLPELHDSLFDSWLLQNFPGRTLDELDDMNILRYLQAMQAREMESIDGVRRQVTKKDGKVKGSDLSPEEWENILELDDLVEQYKKRFTHG